MTKPNTLNEQEQALRVLRDQIDDIDLNIQRLINQRAECASKVADVKQRYGQSESPVFYRPEREAQVLRRVMERNTGPLPDHEMARLFREIMSSCLALEQPVKVAFMGPENNYTEQAVRKHFGLSAQSVAFASLEQVFKAVMDASCHYAVLPIESPQEGLVSHTLDLLGQYDVFICGEVELQLGGGALSSTLDTRFLVLGRQQVAPSGCDKTSILIRSEDDRPGALYSLLEPFRKRGISLTRLETRSNIGARPGSLFYMDFEGHRDDETVAEVLLELQSTPVILKILGSYPQAVL